MKFKDALNTGYRIQYDDVLWRDIWCKKINEREFLYSPDNRIFPIDKDYYQHYSREWHIHPEDQKLIDFTIKLDEALKEPLGDI